MYELNQDQKDELVNLMGFHLLNVNGGWLEESMEVVFGNDKKLHERIMKIIENSPKMGVVCDMLDRVCEVAVEVLLEELNA